MEEQFEDEFIEVTDTFSRYMIWAQWGIITMLCTAVLIMVMHPKPPPSVVVLKDGQIIGVARPIPGAQSLEPEVWRWAVGNFIKSAHAVRANADEEHELLLQTYASVQGQAWKVVNDYYHEPDRLKFIREGKGYISVQLTRSPLVLTAPNEYQVDWVETEHDYNSTLEKTSIWRATVSVVTAPPTDRNPLGLFINTIDWEPEVH